MKTTRTRFSSRAAAPASGAASPKPFTPWAIRSSSRDAARSNLDETTAANPGMKSLTVDMTDAGSIRAFAAQVTQDHPTLNVLINMAGVMRNEKLLDQKEPLADAEATIATNLLGPIRLTAALLPTLLKQPHATIMNVSSGLAFVPLAMTPTYCATKAADPLVHRSRCATSSKTRRCRSWNSSRPMCRRD